MKHEKIINTALKFMVENFNKEICLDSLASHVGVTKFYLCRVFKQDLQISPICWLWKFRVFVSVEIISHRPVYPLNVISRQCGFKNQCHFARYFKNELKMRPSVLRKVMLKQRLTVASKVLYKSLYDIDLVQSAFAKAMSVTNRALDIQLIDLRLPLVYKTSKKPSRYSVRL